MGLIERTKLNNKKLMLVGGINIILSIILLIMNFYDLFQEKGKQNICLIGIVSILFVLTSFFFVTLIITCLESILIIFINNRFDFRGLYFSNYLFLSQGLLINMLGLCVSDSMNKIALYVIIMIMYLICYVEYCFRIIRKALVDKKAVLCLSSLIGLFTVLFIIV